MQQTAPISIPLTHDGRNRPYLLQVPRTMAAGRLPLLLELHGRGIDAAQFDRLTGFGSLADELGLVVAMPSAVAEVWNDGRSHSPKWAREPDDVGYLAAVMDDVCARSAIDSARIYVVGMSNGAVMAGRLACTLSERIAAVAQIAGTAGIATVATTRPSRPVAVLNIHGTADKFAPYVGGIAEGLGAGTVLRRAAGPMVGIDDWAAFWVAANGARDDLGATELPPDTTIRTWRGASSESDVVFYRVEDGGHTWPGSRIALPAFMFGRTSRTFDATKVAWEFLAGHTR